MVNYRPEGMELNKQNKSLTVKVSNAYNNS